MKNALRHVATHWQTSLAGFGSAALTLWAGGLNWKTALAAAAAQTLGAAARDPQQKPGEM